MIKRCPVCHVAIIPDEVIEIWQEKFSMKTKPPYYKICRVCGCPAGEHFGTDCPENKSKKALDNSNKEV